MKPNGLLPPYSDCTNELTRCRCTVTKDLIVQCVLDEYSCSNCKNRHGLDLNVYAEMAKKIAKFKQELIRAFKLDIWFRGGAK